MKVGKVFQTLRSVGLCTHCTFAQEFALFFRIPPFLAAIPALLLNKEATDVACLTLLPSPSIPSAVREGTKPTHPPTLSPSQSDPFFLPVPPLSLLRIPFPFSPTNSFFPFPQCRLCCIARGALLRSPFGGAGGIAVVGRVVRTVWWNWRPSSNERTAFGGRGGWKTSGAVSLSGKRIEGVQGWKGHLAKGGLDLLPFFAILLLQKKGLRSQKDPNGRCLTLLPFPPSLLALHSCCGIKRIERMASISF